MMRRVRPTHVLGGIGVLLEKNETGAHHTSEFNLYKKKL
jgi:hypothetical protein